MRKNKFSTPASILVIEHVDSYGGGQAQFVETILALQDGGINVAAAFPRRGILEQKLRANIFNVKFYPFSALRLRTGKKSLLDFLKIIINVILFGRFFFEYRKYDVWHVNGGRALIPVIMYAWIARRRVSYHMHIDHGVFVKKLLNFFLRYGLVWKLICCSEYVRAEFLKSEGSLCNSFAVVTVTNCLPLWADELDYSPKFALGDHFDFLNIGIIGRISMNKGQSIAIDLSSRLPYAKFFLIGDVLEGEDDHFKKIKLNSSGRIFFLGHCHNINSTLRLNKISLVLVPSRVAESFGLVAIEAMSCSCFVIASNIGGLVEISKNTGMPTYNSFDELILILDEFMGISSEERNSRIRSLYDNCKRNYSSKRFKEMIIRELCG